MGLPSYTDVDSLQPFFVCNVRLSLAREMDGWAQQSESSMMMMMMCFDGHLTTDGSQSGRYPRLKERFAFQVSLTHARVSHEVSLGHDYEVLE